MQEAGFLGTAAPRAADIVLLLEMGMGVGLLAGALFARARWYRLHAVCQSLIVVMNLALIALAMFPTFHSHVLPGLPGRIGRSYYALAATHAAMGGVAEIAALYILVAAGTNLLPAKFRITRYKLWMQRVLLIWWIVLLLGMATYARWYMSVR